MRVLRLLLSSSSHLLRVTFLWVLLLPHMLHIIGGASNDLVMFANGGRFPVMISPVRQWNRADASGMLDRVHCVMTSKTHLNLLADIIDRNDVGIFSIGDALIDMGEEFSIPCNAIWFALVILKLLGNNDQPR